MNEFGNEPKLFLIFKSNYQKANSSSTDSKVQKTLDKRRKLMRIFLCIVIECFAFCVDSVWFFEKETKSSNNTVEACVQIPDSPEQTGATKSLRGNKKEL